MKMNLFWTLFGILILLILSLIYLNFFHQKTEVIEAKQEPIEFYQTPQDCSYLEARIASLEEKFLILEGKFEQQASRPVAQTTTRVRTTPAPTPAPTPEPETEPEPVKANTSDLSHVKNVNGHIIFCVMANNDKGMHFPQYAMDRNVRFTSVKSNSTGDGNLWIVNPATTMEGDYGITHDGTFFVSHDVLQTTMSQTLTSLAIKSEFTRWQPLPMTKQNGYWIYKTR